MNRDAAPSKFLLKIQLSQPRDFRCAPQGEPPLGEQADREIQQSLSFRQL